MSKTDLTEVTIKIRAFPYYIDAFDPLTEKKVKREVVATRGQTVQLNDYDLERAERLDAIVVDAVDSEEEVVELDIDLASVEELAEWIEEDKPTINELVAAATSPEVAQRLLAAENIATGEQPRAGLVKGLTEVIERGNA